MKNCGTNFEQQLRQNTEMVYPEGTFATFARLFWEEQLKASSGKKGRQNRWHPLMIKWCMFKPSITFWCYLPHVTHIWIYCTSIRANTS